jgi:hypothetical protein
MIPLACALAGTLVAVACALLVRREIEPTTNAIDRFAGSLAPALARVRDEARHARRRLDPDR